jgi:hypothetical protein
LNNPFNPILYPLATLPFVENPQINLEKRANRVGFVHGAIEFTPTSAPGNEFPSGLTQ